MSSFYAFCNIFFGTIAGLLMAVPITMSSGDSTISSPGLLIAFTLLGAATGFRRRLSRGFFYLSLFTTITLLTVLGLAWLPSE